MNDAAYCRQIVRTHARTFWLASHFLGPAKQRSAFALYAFCRVADDLVDLACALPAEEVARQLDDYRSQLDRALRGEPEGPVFRELYRTVQLHEVPSAVLHELLGGIASDCSPSRYGTWSELEHYCEGVASTVGEMCTYVFGVVGGPTVRRRALVHARTLGVAMQLTNILRDIGEDARNGRCYLPDEDLERYGLDREAVLSGVGAADDRWRRLMSFEIARARGLYASAAPGIALLAPDTQRCASACANGYAGILGAIEANAYDTFRVRARLGARARATLLWNVWRTPLALSGTGEASAPPASHPDGEMVTWASATHR